MNIKKIMYVVLLLFVLTNLLSCDFFKNYRGGEEELFTVAVNSILGSDGSVWHGDRPVIEVLEEDDFGRILFYYYEQDAVSSHNLIISQKVLGDYVYYYPDYNIITNFVNNFSDAEIESLKQHNDWDKALQEDKMVCKRISGEKECLEFDEDSVLASLSEIMNTDKENFQYWYFTSDDFGRSAYLLLLYDAESAVNSVGKFEYEYYVVILQKDYSYNENSMIKLKDNYNYQDQLSEFKKINNWNSQ